jgi:hypothetical protein
MEESFRFRNNYISVFLTVEVAMIKQNNLKTVNTYFFLNELIFFRI